MVQLPFPPFTGVMLEGLEEWEIQPDEIVLGPRIGIGRCGALCTQAACMRGGA